MIFANEYMPIYTIHIVIVVRYLFHRGGESKTLKFMHIYFIIQIASAN